MTEFIKTKLREVLLELNTQKKPLYNFGVEHRIFASSKDPNILYKVGDKYTIVRSIDVFKQDPTSFPIIYRGGKTKRDGEEFFYIAVEKLDAPKAKAEYGILLDILVKHKVVENWLQFSDLLENMTKSNRSYVVLSEIFEKENQIDMFNRWYTLLGKINPIIKKIKGWTDYNRSNFGYDKNGNLKCLDI